MITKVLLHLILFLVVSSCGIKGDPLPPAEQQTIQLAPKVVSEASPNSEVAKPVAPKKVLKK